MCCYLVAWLLSSVFLFCLVLLLFNSFTNNKLNVENDSDNHSLTKDNFEITGLLETHTSNTGYKCTFHPTK